MPVAIRDYRNDGAIPTHQSGDVLVVFAQNYYTSVNSGWTLYYSTPVTWAYDNISVAYCVATSNSTVTPFAGGHNYAYSLSGAKTSAPVSGAASGHAAAWAAPNPFPISAVSTSPGGIRLTFAAGYGSGGNSPFGSAPSTSLSTDVQGIRNWSSYHVMIQGFSGSAFTINGSNVAGGSLAWASLAIEPAPASGFFAMF